MSGETGQFRWSERTHQSLIIVTRHMLQSSLNDLPSAFFISLSQIQILPIASRICSRMDAEAPVSMVMGRLVHHSTSVGARENCLRIERCRSRALEKAKSERLDLPGAPAAPPQPPRPCLPLTWGIRTQGSKHRLPRLKPGRWREVCPVGGSARPRPPLPGIPRVSARTAWLSPGRASRAAGRGQCLPRRSCARRPGSLPWLQVLFS